MAAQQQDVEWCPNCGQPARKLNNFTGWCNDCSRTDPYILLESYLEENADHIEHYLLQGNSLLRSVELTRTDYRPTCQCCGVLIKHAPRQAQFCSRNDKCKWASNRYRYLYKRRNFTKAQALAQTLRELSS